jgi:hypothetical protein
MKKNIKLGNIEIKSELGILSILFQNVGKLGIIT